MRGFNLDYLQTFVDVLQLGSFSAAAARLGLTQPAVSLQVRQLEKHLGVRLIERVGRRARPTPAGEALLAHAATIEATVDAAIGQVGQFAREARGPVRLGSGATACLYLFPQVLSALRAEFPNLDITVTTGNTVDILRGIEENTIDIGLVTLPATGRIFDITPLLRDEFVLIAPPGQSLPPVISPAVLATLPLLLYEPESHTRRIFDRWLALHGVTLRPVMSLGSVEAIKRMARAGLGCAVVPGMAVQLAADREGLQRQSMSPPFFRELAVVMRRDKRLHRGLAEARRALLAVAQNFS